MSPAAGKEASHAEEKRYLLDKLKEQVNRHDPSLAPHYRYPVRPGHAQVLWHSHERTFLRDVTDWYGIEQRVKVSLPYELGDVVRIGCTCQVGQRQGRCQHTWELLHFVLEYLRQEEDPIVQEALRLGERPAWTRTLALLDGLLATSDRTSGPAAEPERRLTWRVRFHVAGLSLGAWEQKVSKRNGKWTAGRRVSWERLSFATQWGDRRSDRRAIAAITRSDYAFHDGEWSIDTFEALRALVGHPLVFSWDGPTRNLSVEEGELGLAVRPQKGGLTLDGALGGRPLSSFPSHDLFKDPEGRGLIGYDAGAGRIVVGSMDQEVVEFVLAAGADSLTVPEEGQEELLRRLTRLESLIPLTFPSDLFDATRPGDPWSFLRLEPGELGGLEARLLVKPTPQSACFTPGQGPVRLLGLDEGQHVLIERQLTAETSMAREQAGRLGLDENAEEQPWQWRFDDDDEALDLVLAAQEQATRGLEVEWPEGESRRVASAITAQALRIRVRDRRDWFGVEGSVEGDGWSLPLLALLQALREGRRYVPVGDGTWAVITRELRERLAALDDVVHVHRKRLEVGVTAAPVLRDLADKSVTVEASRRFKQLLRRLEAAEDFDADPPAALTAELRGYQAQGYRWLRRLAAWGVGGCLADDMGLGKTVQTLAVLIDRSDVGPALVVAPTSVGFNWVREAERFAPSLNVWLYRETDRDAILGELGKGDVVVASYGLLLRDAAKLARVKWATLVLDEAQAIKNSRTKTAGAVRNLDAEWRLALTGTPVENHLGELWSLFRAISPGLFGSWERFAERFAAPIEKHHDPERRQALSRLLRPFVLRRTKSEVLTELPERTEVRLSVELDPEERQLYEAARLKALMELSSTASGRAKRGREGQERFQVLAALTRLRQLACHPALVDPEWAKDSAKLRLLLETLEELRDGEHRALVFSQFTRHLGLVRRALDERGIGYQYLDGRTSARKRTQRIDAFQDGAGDVFLISLKAGGTGLNLTGADYVIHMDPWWNPAVEDQATDRAHRIGQTRPVTVYRLVTRDTIEEEILRLHSDKRDLVAGVLAGTDQAGKLSTDELVGLIRSGGETTAEQGGKARLDRAMP